MSQAYEHNPGDHEDPQADMTWLIGFVGTFMLIVIVLGVTALLKTMERRTVDDVVVRQEPVEVQNLEADERSRIEGGARREWYLDAESSPRQRIVIPIDRAIELTVTELNEGA